MTTRKVKPVEAKTTKTLILKLNGDRESRVEVPVESKVTFGPAIPAPSKGYSEVGQREYAVRVYDGPTEKAGLLAVFTNVREFRVDTVKVDRLVVREHGKAIWSNDENGFEMTQSVKRGRKLLADGDDGVVF